MDIMEYSNNFHPKLRLRSGGLFDYYTQKLIQNEKKVYYRSILLI